MQIFTQTHSGRSLVIAGALLLYTVLARPSTSLQP